MNMKATGRQPARQTGRRRSGLSSLDYILVLGVILPLAAFIITAGKRMIQLVYEMIVVLMAWPFM
jgi:hypothetical protein